MAGSEGLTDRPPCQTDTIESAARRAATPRDREREQARRIVDACNHLHEAKRGLAAKGGNGDIFENVLRADEDLIRGLIILLGINPENEGDNKPGGAIERWDSRSRRDQLAGDGGAWFYFDRVAGFVGEAVRESRTRKRAAAGLAHLENAQGILGTIDRTLWREPVTDMPTIGRPGIGHGSVNLVCKRIYQGTVYDRRWFLGSEPVNRVPPWLPTYRRRVTEELRSQVSHYIAIQSSKVQAIGLFCDIYDEPADRQCRVHDAFRLLWVVAPEHYRAIYGDPLSDGWFTSDDLGGWGGFFLPKCGGGPR